MDRTTGCTHVSLTTALLLYNAEVSVLESLPYYVKRAQECRGAEALENEASCMAGQVRRVARQAASFGPSIFATSVALSLCMLDVYLIAMLLWHRMRITENVAVGAVPCIAERRSSSAL